jgi:hypothetical protein
MYFLMEITHHFNFHLTLLGENKDYFYYRNVAFHIRFLSNLHTNPASDF